jgi:glycosyltransferase involved in cell wall biosynthesis/sugar phosphate isomerase/epimerase
MTYVNTMLHKISYDIEGVEAEHLAMSQDVFVQKQTSRMRESVSRLQSGELWRKSKVGMIHYSFTPGGVGNVMNKHACLLNAGGVDVEILAGHVGMSSREGVLVEREGSFEFYSGGNQEQMYQRLKAWVQDKDAVVIHNILTQPHGNRDLYEVLRGRIIPEEKEKRNFVAWTHDTEPRIERIGGVQYTAISEKTQRELQGLCPDGGVPLTSNAISYRGFLTPRLYAFYNKHELFDQDYTFIYPARWAENKNIERAIRILAAFKWQLRKRAKLVVVSGPANPFYEGDMKRLIRETGTEREIVLTREDFDNGEAWVPSDMEMERLYQLSDALLFTSWQEGFGLPIIEAALGKTPVITLDVPPHADLLQNANLRLPAWRNNPEEDASEIEVYLENENKTVAAARRVRQLFQLERIWQDVVIGVLGFQQEAPNMGAQSSRHHVRPSGETYPVEDQLEKVAEEGFGIFEILIDGYYPSEIYKATRKWLLKRARELGVKFQVHAPIGGGPGLRDDEMHLWDTIVFAGDIGAELVILRMDQRDGFVPMLDRLLSKASKRGIQLALENGPRDSCKSLNEVVSGLMRHRDHVGVAFNVGFAALMQSPLDYLDELNGPILSVCLLDARAQDGLTLRIGEGRIDFRRIIPRLMERVGADTPQILGYWHPQRRADKMFLECCASMLTKTEKGFFGGNPSMGRSFPAIVSNARIVTDGTPESDRAKKNVEAQLPAARKAVANAFGADADRIPVDEDLTFTAPREPDAAADTDGNSRIGINPELALTAPPEQIRALLIHELLHIVYPDDGETEICRRTVRTLEKGNLFLPHREYLTQSIARHRADPRAFAVLPTELWRSMIGSHSLFTKMEGEGDFYNTLVRDREILVAAHIQIPAGHGRRVVVAMPAGKAALCFETEEDVRWSISCNLSAFAEADGQRGIQFVLSTDLDEVTILSDTVLLNHMLMARFGILEEEKRLRHLVDSGKIREIESRLGMPLHDIEGRDRVLGPMVDAAGGKAVFTKRAMDGKHGYRLELASTSAFEIRVIDGHVRIARRDLGSDELLRLTVRASVDFEPLTPIPLDALLNDKGKAQIEQDSPFLEALQNFEFLFYEEKPLAGSLNFQSYFGRDGQIALMNMWSVLSDKAKRIGVQSVLDQVSSKGVVNVTDEWSDDRSHVNALAEFFRAYDANNLEEACRTMRQILDGNVPAHPWFDVLDPTFMFPSTVLHLVRDIDDAGLRSWLLEKHAVLERSETRLTTLLLNWNYILDSAGPYAQAWQILCRKYPGVAPLDIVAAHRDEFRALSLNLVCSISGMGNWRDTLTLFGHGRFPEDINANLIPMAVTAIPEIIERIEEVELWKEMIDSARADSLDVVTRYLEERSLFRNLREAWDWDLIREHYRVRRSVAESRQALRRYIEAIDARQFGGDELRARLEKEMFPRRRLGRDGQGDVTVEDFLYRDRVPDEAADGLEFTAVVLDEYGTPFPDMHSDDIYFSLFGSPTTEQFRKILQTIVLPYPLGLGLWDDHAGFVVNNACHAPPSWGIWGWQGADLQAAFSPVQYHGAVAWGWVFSALLCGIRDQLNAGIDDDGTLRNGLTRGDVLLFRKLLHDCLTTIRELRPLVNSELWQYYPVPDSPTGRVEARPIGVSTPIQLWSIAPKGMLIEEALSRIDLALGGASE